MNIKMVLLFIVLTPMLGANGQSNSAIDSLENALTTAKEDTVKVNHLNALSWKYKTINDWQMSFQYAESALELATELDYKMGIAESHKIMGIALRYQGNYEGALNNLFTALKIFEDICLRRGMAHSNYVIGVVKQKQGKRTDALKHLLASIHISQQIDHKVLLAESHDLAGTIYKNKGIYPQALKHNFAALKLREEIGNKGNIARSYNYIGIVYKNKGDYVEALNYYFASLKIKESIGHKGRAANTHNNIGNVYTQLDNYDDALKHHMAALKLREEIGSKRGIGISYLNIGSIKIQQGNHLDAKEDIQTGFKIMKEFGSKLGIASYYSNIGTIYDRQGNYGEALKNHLAALDIFQEAEIMARVAHSYSRIGILYRKLKKYEKARKFLNDGLLLAKKIGNKDIIKDSYKSLSVLEHEEGNLDQALELYKKYVLYNDSLINKESSNQIALLNIEYDVEKKDQEIALLNKENKIKALQLNQQRASLLTSRLEAGKNKSEVQLLNNSMEIQQLKLLKTQRDLELQEVEAQMKDAQLVLLNKDRVLKEEQLERQKLVRNTMISVTTLLLLVGLLLYRSLRLRKKLEKQQVILKERKRISADLHDDIGSGLTKIMLLSELVKHNAKMPGTRKDAERITTISQELSSNISEIIWALNANNNYLNNLVAYIRRYAAEYFDHTPVRLKITTPDNIDHIPIRTENRRNIFYTVKEVLHNIIKHSKATEAKLDFELDNDILSVIICDNGIGMPEEDLNPFGNGIKNMRHRMTNINGEMNIENKRGTKITLKVPV